MPERVVYWKALADFSKVRREAAKTEAALKSLEDQNKKTTTSNDQLGRSEDTVAAKTNKSSSAVSSAVGKVQQAREKSTKAAEEHTRATNAEASASRASAAESARAAKAHADEARAQGAVTAATERLSSARAEQERVARKLASAENELSKVTARQVKDAKEIEVATKHVQHARDQQARADERAKTAAVSFTQSQQRLAQVQAASAFESQKAADAQARAEGRKAKAAEDSARRQEAAMDKLHAAALKEETARSRADAADARRAAAAQKREEDALQSTISRNNKLVAEFQRLEAARKAADSVARRSPAGAAGSINQDRLSTVQNAVNRRPEELYSSGQIKAVNALTRAETQLKAARDNEVATFNRLYETEQQLAVARSNSDHTNRMVTVSEANYADALRQHGEASAQALEADGKLQAARRDSERALNAERSAENAVTRVRQSSVVATDRVASSVTRMNSAIRNADREFKASAGGGNIFTRAGRGIANMFNEVDKSAGKALHSLRGFFWPALAGGAYLLVAALSSLVSGLFALGSAVAPAIGAIAALGPALFAVAGAAGTVMAAFSGVGGVLKAYQQQQLKAAEGSTKAAKTEVNNADAIISAQQQLADAREQVGITARNVADDISNASHQVVEADQAQLEAVQSLDQARKDAKKTIDDLKNAVLDAALAERGAMLDLADAQSSLQHVLADPTSTRAERERAQLSVDQAKKSASDAQKNTQDVKSASTAASTAGVEGDKGVIDSRKQVADANYAAAQAQKQYNETVADGARQNRKALQAVASAERALNKAQVSAADSGGAAATAADAFKAKLDALTPAARKFVLHLIALQKYWKQLKNTASSGLFPGLTKAMDTMVRGLFPTFNKGLGLIAKGLGDIAVSWSKLLTQGQSKDMFAALFGDSPRLLNNFSGTLQNVFKIFRSLMPDAIVLANKLAGGIEAWTANLAKSADAADKNGKVSAFFDRSYRVLHQLGQITKNLGTALFNVAGTARSTGQSILDSIQTITKRWAEWTGNVDNQGKLRKFFADVRVNLAEVDRVLGKIALGFIKMGASKSLQPILKGLEDIGNAIASAFQGNTGLVKDIAEIMHNFATIIRELTANSAGLKVFLTIIGGFAKAASAVLAIKPLAVALGGLLAVFAAFKALKFVGSITGLTKLGKAMKGFRDEARLTGGVLQSIKTKFNNLPGVRQIRARRAAAGEPGGTGPTPPSGPTPAGSGAANTRRRAANTRRAAAGLPPLEEQTNRLIRGTDEALGRGNAPAGSPGGQPRGPRGRRMRGFGRGAALGAGVGIGVAGIALGDTINDHRGGARQAVGGALSGAGQGAMIGAIAGPWGMAAGAAIGGIVGILQNSKIGQKIAKWWKTSVWPFIKRLPEDIIKLGKQILHWIEWPFVTAFTAVKTAINNLIAAINKYLLPISSIVKNLFDGVSSFFRGVFTLWKNLFLAAFNIIKDIVTGNFGDIWNQIKRIWDGILAYLSGTWDLIKGLAAAAFDYIRAVIELPFRLIWTFIKLIWGQIKAYLRLEWNLLKTFAASIWNGIKVAIVTPFKEAFTAVKTAWSAVWSWLKAAWTSARTITGNIWHGIASGISAAFNGVGAALSKVWDGIKSVFAGAVNFIIDKIINPLIHAVNWVITKFGSSKISDVQRINLNTGGLVPSTGLQQQAGTRFALAEGGTTPRRVRSKVPGFTPGRDPHEFKSASGYTVALSGGEGILTPETVQAIGGTAGVDALNASYSPRLRQKSRFKKAMRSIGMENYADGGISLNAAQYGSEDQRTGYNKFALWRFLKGFGDDGGGIIGGIGDAFNSAVGLIRNGAGAVVKGTFEGLEAPIRALVDNIPVGFLKKMVNGLFGKVNNGVYNIIAGHSKNSNTKVADDAVYTGKVNGNNARNDVMVSGLTLNNMTDNSFNKSNYRDRMVSAHPSEIAALRTIIDYESGWNASAINRKDSNAKAGHPSQGLMQTIPSTFEGNKNPNLNRGILDAVANVTAGINYANHTYGSLSQVPGVEAVNSGGKYVGYHSGGVVYGLNKTGNANNAISGLMAQAGITFPSGSSKWSGTLSSLFASRLRGVNKYTDVTNRSASPTVQGLLSPDSATTKYMMNWVDSHDPKTYGALWSQQPYGESASYPNKYHRNPLLPILSYLGGTSAWNNHRNEVDSAYWYSVAKKDQASDKARKRSGAKYDLASTKKRHPDASRAISTHDAEWKRDLGVLSGAAAQQKARIGLLRSYLGLKGSGANAGMFASDMQNPLDHAAAHALGLGHPADWEHPWSGGVTVAQSGLADQDRSNALNMEWNNDLSTLAGWGLPNLVDFLLDKGISDGMTLARSAVADRKTATQLDASISAGKVIHGSPDDQASILQIIAKLSSGTAARPFGLRDVSSFLNVPDYSVVNLFGKMTEQLKTIPETLKSKFINDVGLFRQGLFYANSGALVPGDRSQDRDIVPAMLTPGEGVLNRKAMALLGESDFNKLNQGVNPQYLNSGGFVLSPQLANVGLGAAAGMTANGRNALSKGAGLPVAQTINLNTNIINPSGENSVYSMNKNLRRQSALGTVARVAGS